MKKAPQIRRPKGTVPRKAPSQARSRTTVDSILRATARILVTEGYERTSTNKIAQLAGVSIGSLYQYFPSKESLIRSLHDEHVAKIQAILVADPALLGQPIEVVARALVKSMLAVHAVNPALHAQLMQAGAALGISPTSAIYETGITLVKALMRIYAPTLRELDPELSPFVIVCAVEAIIHQASKDHPEYFTNPRLIEEVTQLLTRYVKP